MIHTRSKRFVFSIISFILLSSFSCEKNIGPEIEVIPTDTVVFSVELLIDNSDILDMKRTKNGLLLENIVFHYTDSIVIKSIFNNESLARKSVYFLNESNYADSSIDSIFQDDLYFKTYYEYDERNCLIKETHLPGVYSYIEITDLSSYTYTVITGNKITTQYQPSSETQGTTFNRFEYSTIPMKYDIIEYNNSILGIPNANLPSSYGTETITPKEGNEGGYTPIKEYCYILDQERVITRFDRRPFQDSIIVSRYNYTYNFK